jgi:hypothetical protein
MMRNPILLGLIGALIAALVVARIAAAPGLQAPIADGNQALQQDAALLLLAGVGISLQPAIGELNRVLLEKEAATFAGLWIEHQPDYHVVVSFTEIDPEFLATYVEAALIDGVEVRTAPVPLAALESARMAAMQIASRLGIPASSAVNVVLNRAELYVLDQGHLDAALRAAGMQLPENAAVITWQALPTHVTDIYGGQALPTCTSGFAVSDPTSGEKGITTAGHCSDAQSFNGSALIYKGGTPDSLSGPYDIQWHRADHAFTVRNLVFDGTNNRLIYGVKFRRSQAVGEWVCKYGLNSGYACGTLATNTQDGVNVRVDNVSVKARDSGGPWFWSNTAYGTTQSTCTLAGGQPCAIYGPADHIFDQLHVNILTK